MAVKKNQFNIWIIRFTFNGQEYNRSAGKGATKGQAEAIERTMRQELIDQQNGFQTGVTIRQAIDRWFNDYVYPSGKRKGLKKPEVYESHLKAVLPHIKGRKLTQVLEVANEMLLAMEKKGLANSTIKKRMNILRRPTNLAHDNWFVLKEPLGDKFPKVGRCNKRKVFLTVEQLEALAQAMDSEKARDLVYFFAYTGLRWREFTDLTKDSLLDNDTTLEVIGKGEEEPLRWIPIQPEQVAFIHKYVPFRQTYSFIRLALDRAKKKVGLEHVTLHDLRHTSGAWLVEHGYNLREIMQILGHTTTSTCELYTETSVDHLRKNPLRQSPTPPPETPCPAVKKPVRIAPVLRVVG